MLHTFLIISLLQSYTAEILGLLFVLPQRFPRSEIASRLNTDTEAASRGLKLRLCAAEAVCSAREGSEASEARVALSFVEDKLCPPSDRARGRIRSSEVSLARWPAEDRAPTRRSFDRLRPQMVNRNVILHQTRIPS
jgi:hypothetical protein